MSEAVITALITGGLALLGTVFTILASQRKTEATITTEIAVVKNEVKHLSAEVEKHNKFAERVPKLEEFKEDIAERVHRLEDFHME